MDHKDVEACVYVKESVLHELEQERRKLKCQLSRALQTSDTRAAELEASKAKVKDLLTIVGVNKGVADQVLQRSHGRDVKRRQELDALHKQNNQQRQRYVELATRSMNRRVCKRQQRDAFRSLHDTVLLRNRRREALMRLQTRSRWRTLRRSFEKWNSYSSSCCTGSAKVFPVSQEQLKQLLPPKGSIMSNGEAGDNVHPFVRWQQLRKVWRHWERVILWKRRHREGMKTVSRRLLRSRFLVWRCRARILRQRRLFLRRILARTKRRLQQLGLSSLRLRCAEVSAHECTDVLKAAQIAMEEEKQLRAEVQTSTANELHTAYIREQHRQQRFQNLLTQRLGDFKRRECKHRTLMVLRCEVIRSRQQNTIALRFQRLLHDQRELRKLFTQWKRDVTRLKRIKNLIAAWEARRMSSTKATYFKLFTRTLQRKRHQRLRLRALTCKLRRNWLLRGWLCLSIRSAIEEHKAIAHIDRWQFSQQAEAMRDVYQQGICRSRKVALKYQITCALLMADKSHQKLLRKVLSSWSKRTAIHRRQRRTLRKLVVRRDSKVLHAAIRKWNHSIEEMIDRCSQLHRYQSTRRHRVLEASFKGWKCKLHETLRTKLTRYQQRSCFHQWRQWLYIRQQQLHSLVLFQKRSSVRWQRQAFQSWKQKHEFMVKVCTSREHTTLELMSRLWRRWLGFVAFRLHTQRRQQQKALIGVRTSLQQTILSTAFMSWRANWDSNQAREKLIVRIFRRTTSHSRISRYLQAWHRHSTLMNRRRAALKKVCRQNILWRLQTKWHQWVRQSLCAAISKLESSSTQAQQQVNCVVHSTSRSNTLRRILRKWSQISAETKEQQHRQALFAEKRRYLALQTPWRQWHRKIMRCSLSKQNRVLQQLLNSLRMSVERRAFRLWERKTHLKTLSERDRISAELFRRSETRVLVLAQEIRAERERRTIFTSWRSITAQRRKTCGILQRVSLKQQRWLLQNSWTAWRLHTQRQHCIVRLQTILAERLKAHAWHKLMQMYHRHGLRLTGAQKAGIIWHRIRIRQAWNCWKRVDSCMVKHAALAEVSTSAVESMLAFKTKLAKRHYRKRFSTRIFAEWRQRVACTKRLRRHLCAVLQRQVEFTTAYHFQRWRKVVEHLNHFQQILFRALKLQEARKVRLAVNRWRVWILEVAHRQQLEETKRTLTRQREVSAQRIAVVKFLSWQRPCLETHFIRWKTLVEQRRRYVVEQRIALSHHRTRSILQTVWRSWNDVVCRSKRRAFSLAKTLYKTRHGLLKFGLYRWDQWSSWTQDIGHVGLRLIRMHELWQWRRGFAALRQHHHEVTRRQSIMAASSFSAHSVRQRERQAKQMRAVAQILKRKSSSALCDRCFRHWMLYVKTKARMNSMMRRVRVRSEKRVSCRCFVKWRTFVRQNAIVQLKIHRRRETWERRRQETSRRRIWNAWLLFTQHSVDVKHCIYDRLVIRAARHTLQGAWGRWKSYTKYATAVLDAQRVARWENAVAERDRVMDTLQDKHERLILRAAQLGQRNHVLQQRLLSSGTRKVHHVLERGCTSRASAAFAVWEHKLRQVRALQSRITALSTNYQRFALRHWHLTISQLRAAEDAKRVQLAATEWAARVVHTCATQWLKRRTLVSWKAFARVHRGIKRYCAAAKRRREWKLVASCWTSWKSTLDVRAEQADAITAFQQRKSLKLQTQAYWRWRSVYEHTCFAKHNAVQTLLLLWHARKRRLLRHGLICWRFFVAEEDAAISRMNLVLVKMEQQNTTAHHTCLQLLLSTFSNWRLYTRSQSKHRDGIAQLRVAASHRRLVHCSFARWKQKTARGNVQILLFRRMQRHLRRHHQTLTKFALWTWFARVQADSCAVTRMTTQLHVALKQFTATTDVAARVARALLTDLVMAEHRMFRSQQRSAWRLVNVTLRNANRRQLQSALHRLASSKPVSAKRHFLMPTHVANARAFADKLATVLLRSGFQHWKQQYVVLALQEAEEAQQELLRALHHVTSYRHALDPYTRSI